MFVAGVGGLPNVDGRYRVVFRVLFLILGD